MPTFVVGGGFLKPTLQIDLLRSARMYALIITSYSHSIFSDLGDFDIVKHSNDVRVVVIRTLDLVQKLRFACVDGHQSVSVLLLRNDKFAIGLDLDNGKCEI